MVLETHTHTHIYIYIHIYNIPLVHKNVYHMFSARFPKMCIKQVVEKKMCSKFFPCWSRYVMAWTCMNNSICTYHVIFQILSPFPTNSFFPQISTDHPVHLPDLSTTHFQVMFDCKMFHGYCQHALHFCYNSCMQDDKRTQLFVAASTLDHALPTSFLLRVWAT